MRAMLDAKAVETLSRLVPRMLATLPPPAARSADADDLPRLINHIAASNQPASAVYKITYWNDQSGTLASRGLQGVFLTNLTFTASSCA